MPFNAAAHATWVSADALSGCLEVATEAGFDVRPVLVRHGIDPELIENSRGLISYQAMSDCLEDIARSENCPDFGFRLGRRQKPLQFGMISQVLQFAPTVGEAIRIFLKYRDLYSQSSHWNLAIDEDYARLNRHDFRPGTGRAIQTSILSVTRGFAAIRSLMEPSWTPAAIYLSTPEVEFSQTMRRFFGAPVFFNAQFDEIAFEAADLERALPTGNPEILKALTAHFDRLFPELNNRSALASQVQKQIRLGLAEGSCSLTLIAQHFGMHPRTLQRGLAVEGTSFRQLENEARMLVAKQMVQASRAQLSEVAEASGYRHLSSLSRAYKRGLGTAPSRDRRASERNIVPDRESP